MANPAPNSHLTAAIILGCFTLIALFAGVALPKMSKNKLAAQIQADNCLTRENAAAWGEVPGLRNIEITKTFTLMSLDTNLDDFLAGKINVIQAKKATYDYKYKYDELQFAPASNNSIQFRKSYSHIYQDSSEEQPEEDLEKVMIKTLNIGGLKGVALQADLSRAQTFIQSLFRIYTSFQDNILTLLTTDYAYLLFISNQTLTNDTIFMFNELVTPEQSKQLWFDIDYGWSKPETLFAWVEVVSGYFTNPGSYKPSTHPRYPVLKSHFKLTDEQMMALVGATPTGQVGPSSVLYTVLFAVQSTISAYNDCKNVLMCDSVELFALQFFDAKITKNPVFEGIKSRDSIADLNHTFAAPPEIAAVTKGKVVDFTQDQANKLFEITQDRSQPAKTQQTLFRIQNVELIMNNQDDPQTVLHYFDLKNLDQAQVLIDYVNYIIDKFAYQGKESLKAWKYTADIASSSMNRLLNEMASLLTVNVTAIGTATATKKLDKDCVSFLADIETSQELVDSVCGNTETNLDDEFGQAIWIRAYIEGPGSDSYSYLQTETIITEEQIEKLLSEETQFGKIVRDVTNAIADSLECPKSPCDAEYVSRIQWGSAGFTLGLPAEYFDGEIYESISDIYPKIFKEFIPEPVTFAKRHLKQEIELSHEMIELFFSYQAGSINNNYEVLKLFSLFQDEKFDEIKTRFGLDKLTLDVFLAYFDHTLINYHLGGLFMDISAYDLLWGYEDPFLKKLNNSNFFENVQLFDTKISLFGEKSARRIDKNGTVGMINSGFDDPGILRTITSREGNQTLSLKKTIFDGNNYVSHFESPWIGALEYITGTDGSGFSTLLQEGSPVTVFEDRFMRNLQYNYDNQYKFGETDYVFNTYKLDSKQFETSERYTNGWDGYMNLTRVDSTPLLVSLPYFKGCEDESYSQVTFDGKPASSYQDVVDPGTFTVESLTGITVNSTKNYQYSISNIFPYFVSRMYTPTAVPLVTVQESYRTPESNFDGDLKSYYGTQKSSTVAMIVALSLAAILAVFTFIFLKKHIGKKNSTSSSTVFNNTNGHNFSSLRVDSDGGRESDSLYQRI